jgi:hypothetical protein
MGWYEFLEKMGPGRYPSRTNLIQIPVASVTIIVM